MCGDLMVHRVRCFELDGLHEHHQPITDCHMRFRDRVAPPTIARAPDSLKILSVFVFSFFYTAQAHTRLFCHVHTQNNELISHLSTEYFYAQLAVDESNSYWQLGWMPCTINAYERDRRNVRRDEIGNTKH